MGDHVVSSPTFRPRPPDAYFYDMVFLADGGNGEDFPRGPGREIAMYLPRGRYQRSNFLVESAIRL
jgi:hypothetical protein